MADITAVHKQNVKTNEKNYRPISILPSVSKIFEKIMYKQIESFMKNILSDYLCGFRKGYSTQYCLLYMLEKWKRALDQGNIAGGILTDLSKAFDCLNHALLIAKLEAYGFEISSLTFIYSYLSQRRQRTKVNNFVSEWKYINLGVPQGSILGPLLFNIYMNDLFYFVPEKTLANYADDNTLHCTGSDIETISSTLENKTDILLKWFDINYFKMNADKCKLMVTKHSDNVSLQIDGHCIKGSNCVKLLGVKIDSTLNYNDHVSSLYKKSQCKITRYCQSLTISINTKT